MSTQLAFFVYICHKSIILTFLVQSGWPAPAVAVYVFAGGLTTLALQNIHIMRSFICAQVGGFYVTTIPVWIAWLKYLSFIYYGYNLLLKIEYVDRTLYDCSGLILPEPSTNPLCTPVPPGGLQGKLHLQVCF